MLGSHLREHRRLDRCGRDAVHPHTGRRELLAERLYQCDDAGFRGAVGGSVGIAFLPRHRGDRDDPAVTGRLHHRNDGARAVERAGEVDVEHLAPTIKRIVGDRNVRAGDCLLYTS